MDLIDPDSQCAKNLAVVEVSDHFIQLFNSEVYMASAATIEEISVSWQDETGRETVKELDRVILSRGAWTTILFKYQDWDAKKETYGPVKFSIRRYKKWNEIYREQSKFNISSVDQAKKIMAALETWIAEGGVQTGEEASEE